MFRHHFQALLGLALLLLTLITWSCQNPGFWRGPITAAEADRYMVAVEKLPLSKDERDATLAAVRAFMAEDDGHPFYMLNLMRFNPALRPIEGAPMTFAGTPQESNAHYEEQVMPLLFKVGGYPAYAGSIQGRNVLSPEAEVNDWSRLLLVRYPSRHAFMELMSNPAYAPLAPYKLMALKVVLTPSHSELVLPPLTAMVAALSLIIFLAVGWWRTARRGPRS